jgi:putative membrane protein
MTHGHRSPDLLRNLLVFAARWLTNAIGMYFVISWFSTNVGQPTIGMALIAGLIFSIVNTVVKPFLKLLSLPFILVTMGLFVLVINGAMVGLTFLLMPSIQISFWPAIGAGLIMSLINYLANLVIVPYNNR